MTDAELSQFKQQLTNLKAELEALQQTSSNATQPVILDQSSVGRLSRIDAMQAQEMAQESARRRQLQLTGIEGALRRIQADDFGYCFVCDEEIDVRRLQAEPTITRCISCTEQA